MRFLRRSVGRGARNAALTGLERRIAEQGWTVVNVLADAAAQEYSYTVGLASKRLPELIMVGMRREVAQLCLNTIAEQLIAGKAFTPGKPIENTFKDAPVAVWPVSFATAQAWLTLAKDLTGDSWPALQVCWPDQQGFFPWQEGYSLAAVEQPILGLFDG